MRSRIIGTLLATLLVAGCQAASDGGGGSSTGAKSSVGPTSAGPTKPAPVSTTAVAPPTFQSVFKKVSSGVVRIDNEGCEFNGTGTGFLIAPDLVATVAHVVGQTELLRITSPGSLTTTKGRVIGIDREHDIALVRTETTVPGHIFRLAKKLPEIGTEIMALGFPKGRSLTLTRGTINALHDQRSVSVSEDEDPIKLSDALVTDTTVNPGNSGGPWVTLSGKVVGITESGPPYDEYGQPEQGENGGVASVNARPYLERWRTSPQDLTFPDCREGGPSLAAIDTLRARYRALDNTDYASAYAQLDPATRTASGLARYIENVKTSQVEALDGSDYFTVDARHDSTGDDDPTTVDVTFRSTQEPQYGQRGERCTIWTQRYSFAGVNGLQLIAGAEDQPGTSGNRPC